MCRKEKDRGWVLASQSSMTGLEPALSCTGGRGVSWQLGSGAPLGGGKKMNHTINIPAEAQPKKKRQRQKNGTPPGTLAGAWWVQKEKPTSVKIHTYNKYTQRGAYLLRRGGVMYTSAAHLWCGVKVVWMEVLEKKARSRSKTESPIKKFIKKQRLAFLDGSEGAKHPIMREFGALCVKLGKNQALLLWMTCAGMRMPRK